MINRKLALDFSNHASLTLGILSDTHGSLHSGIADFIKSCDIALHAGDIMGADVLKSLQPKLGHTIAVKGNNDAYSTWDSHDHALLNELPDMVELTLPGGKLVMEHSHRMWDHNIENIHQALRAEYPFAQLVVYGHTHIRTMNYTVQTLMWLIPV